MKLGTTWVNVSLQYVLKDVTEGLVLVVRGSKFQEVGA